MISLLRPLNQYAANIPLLALFVEILYRACRVLSVPAMVKSFGMTVLILLGGARAANQAQAYRDRETLWRDALRQNPQSVMLHNNLGLELLGRGRIPEARAHLEEALKLDPGSVEAYCNLVLLDSRLHQPDSAIFHYRKALEINPEEPAIHGQLGVVLLEAGRAREASAEFRTTLDLGERLIDKSPNILRAPLIQEAAKVRSNLGFSLLLQGRTDEALGELRRAQKDAPALAVIPFHLAHALLRKKEKAEALSELRQAVALDPGFAEAHRELAEWERQSIKQAPP